MNNIIADTTEKNRKYLIVLQRYSNLFTFAVPCINRHYNDIEFKAISYRLTASNNHNANSTCFKKYFSVNKNCVQLFRAEVENKPAPVNKQNYSLYVESIDDLMNQYNHLYMIVNYKKIAGVLPLNSTCRNGMPYNKINISTKSVPLTDNYLNDIKDIISKMYNITASKVNSSNLYLVQNHAKNLAYLFQLFTNSHSYITICSKINTRMSKQIALFLNFKSTYYSDEVKSHLKILFVILHANISDMITIIKYIK